MRNSELLRMVNDDGAEQTTTIIGRIVLGAAAVLTAVAVSMGTATEAKAETMEPVGSFKLTWYCACRRCSGKWGHRTSSGATCQEGVTVATDYFRPGTRIYIEGFGERIVQDTGVHGRHIDIFLEDHDECNRLGVQHRQVYIVKED